MNDQLAFGDLIEEMEAAERAALDAHRAHVQAWFDGLSLAHKQQLGAWMHGPEWQTCQALSAAACDFYRSQLQQRSELANGEENAPCAG